MALIPNKRRLVSKSATEGHHYLQLNMHESSTFCMVIMRTSLNNVSINSFESIAHKCVTQSSITERVTKARDERTIMEKDEV